MMRGFRWMWPVRRELRRRHARGGGGGGIDSISSRRYQLVSRSPNSQPLYYIIRTSSSRIRLIHNHIYTYVHIYIVIYIYIYLFTRVRVFRSTRIGSSRYIYNIHVPRPRCIKSPRLHPPHTHTHTHRVFITRLRGLTLVLYCIYICIYVRTINSPCIYIITYRYNKHVRPTETTKKVYIEFDIDICVYVCVITTWCTYTPSPRPSWW